MMLLYLIFDSFIIGISIYFINIWKNKWKESKLGKRFVLITLIVSILTQIICMIFVIVGLVTSNIHVKGIGVFYFITSIFSLFIIFKYIKNLFNDKVKIINNIVYIEYTIVYILSFILIIGSFYEDVSVIEWTFAIRNGVQLIMEGYFGIEGIIFFIENIIFPLSIIPYFYNYGKALKDRY